MLDVIAATAGWVVVGWLPGLIILAGLRPGAGLLRNAAFAPVLSLGANMIVAQLFYVLGWSINVWDVLPTVLGASTVALAIGHHVSGCPSRQQPLQQRITPRERAALAVGTLLALLTWVTGIVHVTNVLPNDDGAHHGLYAERIARLGTLNPHQVLAGDLMTGRPSSHYYPLALHVEAALVGRLVGADVTLALTVGMVLAATVCLVLGTFVLARRLFPARSEVAAAAAVLAGLFPWFPHAIVGWGGVPVIVAMSLVPVAVDAVWPTREDGRALPTGVVLGIAAYGVFQLHNTELVTVGVFGVILARPIAQRDTSRRLLLSWAVGVVVLVALVLPSLSVLRTGAGEATTYLGAGEVASTHNAKVSWFEWLLAVGNPFLLPFAAAGTYLVVRRRSASPWLLCGAATFALWLVSLANPPVLRILTIPWYSNSVRVSYLFAYFECTFAAVAVVALTDLVRRRRTAAPASTGAVPSAVVLLALVLLVVGSADLSRIAVRQAYFDDSLVDGNQRAGFRWLADHVAPGSRVLNQFSDGSGWMETLDGVHPVFATKADTRPASPQKIWGDRWYLLSHADQLAVDRRAQAAVRTWKVQYAYVSDRVFSGQVPLLSSAALARSGAYRIAWHRGQVTIFEVTLL